MAAMGKKKAKLEKSSGNENWEAEESVMYIIYAQGWGNVWIEYGGIYYKTCLGAHA